MDNALLGVNRSPGLPRWIAFSGLLTAALGCRAPETPRRPSRPFDKPATYNVVPASPGRTQRFLLQTSGGPATVVSPGGLQRGSDLRVVLMTPAEVTLEPGAVGATFTAIGDSGITIRVVGRSGAEGSGGSVEVFNSGFYPHCCALPASFQLETPVSQRGSRPR